MPEVRAYVDVAAPRSTVWAALTDWQGQGRWMVGTQVEVLKGDGRSTGSVLEARTAVGPVAFTDAMRIVEWQPARRCTVVHLGDIVRGTGIFEVFDTYDGRSRVVWTERLTVPFGLWGVLGWVVAGPMSHVGVQFSLRRFASVVEAQ